MSELKDDHSGLSGDTYAGDTYLSLFLETRVRKAVGSKGGGQSSDTAVVVAENPLKPSGGVTCHEYRPEKVADSRGDEDGDGDRPPEHTSEKLLRGHYIPCAYSVSKTSCQPLYRQPDNGETHSRVSEALDASDEPDIGMTLPNALERRFGPEREMTSVTFADRGGDQQSDRTVDLHPVGSYLWTVEQVSQLIAEAELSRDHTVVANFVTSTGYRFLVQLYLQGEGFGAGSHVSLHFRTLSGQRDNTLTWPFLGQFQISLLDQSGVRENDHTERFLTTRSDPAFSFPVSHQDQDIGAGVPRFGGRGLLSSGRFVRDDRLQIQITVLGQ